MSPRHYTGPPLVESQQQRFGPRPHLPQLGDRRVADRVVGAGEVDGGNPTGTGKDLGKISCMDQELHIRGLPLLIR